MGQHRLSPGRTRLSRAPPQASFYCNKRPVHEVGLQDSPSICPGSMASSEVYGWCWMLGKSRGQLSSEQRAHPGSWSIELMDLPMGVLGISQVRSLNLVPRKDLGPVLEAELWSFPALPAMKSPTLGLRLCGVLSWSLHKRQFSKSC